MIRSKKPRAPRVPLTRGGAKNRAVVNAARIAELDNITSSHRRKRIDHLVKVGDIEKKHRLVPLSVEDLADLDNARKSFVAHLDGLSEMQAKVEHTLRINKKHGPDTTPGYTTTQLEEIKRTAESDTKQTSATIKRIDAILEKDARIHHVKLTRP